MNFWLHNFRSNLLSRFLLGGPPRLSSIRGICFFRVHQIVQSHSRSPVSLKREQGLVLSRQKFELQINLLSRLFRFVHLAEAINILKREEEPVANLAVLTFDEAYYDTIKLALPVLEKQLIPACIFASASLIRKGDAPWHDQLAQLFFCHAPEPLYVPSMDRALRLDSSAERLRSFIRLKTHLEQYSERMRRQKLRDLLNRQFRNGHTIFKANRLSTKEEIMKLQNHDLLTFAVGGRITEPFHRLKSKSLSRRWNFERFCLRSWASNSFVNVAAFPDVALASESTVFANAAILSGFDAAFTSSSHANDSAPSVFCIPRNKLKN